MPSHHNKRGKAKDAIAKEKKSRQYHKKGTQGGGRSRGGGGGESYLSMSASKATNRTHRTFDAADPLDLQLFDYIIVVDVEATCERDHKKYPHEVIELPGVLIDVRKGLVDRERSFHTYIKPSRNPVLTDFCKELTGIKQSDVDTAPTMPEAVQLFEKWYRETIPKGAKVVFAADGPWDFKQFINECHVVRDHVSFPSLFYEYLDIRTTFAYQFNHGVPIKLEAMLARMNLRFEGRPHCGFDDAVNIARLAVAMMRAGCVIDFLLAIPLEEEKYYYHMEGYPLYRRAEGSGKLDRDVVDDIAKSCFGQDYFTFGETHAQEVLNYRVENPKLFANKNAIAMKRRADRAAQRRSRRLWTCVLFVCVAFLLLAALWWMNRAGVLHAGHPRAQSDNGTRADSADASAEPQL